jgi:AbrB family looped-hinge helix DNA binding protein
MLEKLGITTMSERGQVVIPQEFREFLGIKPKAKLLVFAMEGNIIIRKLNVPDVRKEWNDIFRRMDKKGLKLNESDVVGETMAYRKGKRRKTS